MLGHAIAQALTSAQQTAAPARRNAPDVALRSRRIALALPSIPLLLALPAPPALAAPPVRNQAVDDASSAFVQDLLQKTEAKREQRKRERLQDYYRRNFGDYFSFEVGNNKSGISEETRQKIEKWLEDNADGVPPAPQP